MIRGKVQMPRPARPIHVPELGAAPLRPAFPVVERRPRFVIAYHRETGPVEMAEIDANSAVQRFPDEWSHGPWTPEQRVKPKEDE
jgi:hypothetical protein